MKTITLCAALVLCTALGARAQLATPEARSFAFGGAYAARAVGYEASFWNPANLGLSTSPRWSAGLNASAYLSNNALDYGQITGPENDCAPVTVQANGTAVHQEQLILVQVAVEGHRALA